MHWNSRPLKEGVLLAFAVALLAFAVARAVRKLLYFCESANNWFVHQLAKFECRPGYTRPHFKIDRQDHTESRHSADTTALKVGV